MHATIGGRTKPAFNTTASASASDFYASDLGQAARCVLITHADTLFSIFTPDVRTGDLRLIGRFVVPMIDDALDSGGLPSDIFGHLVSDDDELAKTADRACSDARTSWLGTASPPSWIPETSGG
jgi:hypothetical protein